MTPTPEQLSILALAKSPKSLIIHALAGAAKTTTLCLLAAKLPVVPTVSVAFNKRIADEMGKRLPSHIQSSTLNSLGHRVWGQKIGKRLTLSTDKSYSTLTEIINGPGHRPEDKKRLGEAFASILRTVRLAKASGYIPHKYLEFGKSLCTQDELIAAVGPQIDVNPDDEFLFLVDQVLERSIADAWEGKIDFDDQIYMSTLFGGRYPVFPIVMVDEAQDLSPLNHETLSLMYGGRVIAVGDPYQSIYAFRGAHISSMDILAERFSMQRMDLSISFRCPKRVVERARSRAPHMEYPEWAEEGIVERLSEWSASSIPDGATILCRNNAPLLKVAMYFIRHSRGVKLVGFDIGKNLVTIMTKLGPQLMPSAEACTALDEWEKAQLTKAHESRRASITDRAECMRVFLEATATLAEAIAYAEMIFNASGPIQLMTGHKSKGGEWDVVFHLDSWRIPSKFAVKLAEETGDTSQLEQEKNLEYVINTRSKKALYFINADQML